MPAPSLVLLAAGMGSRFGGLKQLAPVGPCGEAIFDYTVRDAEAAGVSHVVVIVRPEIRAEIEQHVITAWPSSVDVDWVIQEVPPSRSKPLGTGHAVLATRPVVDGPFLVLNADDHYGAGCLPLVVAHLTESDEHALAGFKVSRTMLGEGPVNRGRVWVDADNAVTGVAEGRVTTHPDGSLTWEGAGQTDRLAGDEPVSMNLWGFQQSLYDWLEREWEAFMVGEDNEFLLPSVVDAMIRAETVRLLPCDDWCLGVTHADDLPLIQAAAKDWG